MKNLFVQWLVDGMEQMVVDGVLIQNAILHIFQMKRYMI